VGAVAGDGEAMLAEGEAVAVAQGAGEAVEEIAGDLGDLAAGLAGQVAVVGDELNLTGPFWDFMANFDLNKAGFVIVGIFVLTWVVALSIWRFGHIEQKWEAHTVTAGDRD
jgi:hypothetical protein